MAKRSRTLNTALCRRLSCAQGVLAAATDLEEVFGTTNQEEICREILDRGELQISDKERQAELTK
jgi:ribosome maturation protein SDO1